MTHNDHPHLKELTAKGYAHPESLVTTEWAAAHHKDTSIRFVEVDVDNTSYDKGHIPGAIAWHWQNDLQDRRVCDLLDPRSFAELLRRSGISPQTTVVLYGDNNNWFAAWAFWQLKYYGHKDVRLIDGGRKKWELEKKPLTTEVPHFPKAEYPIPNTDETIRAYRRQVEDVYSSGRVNLVDVRSPDEFTGKLLAPPGLPETCQRGGHIPGASNVPWAKSVGDDGSFKTADALRDLYSSAGVDFSKPTIAYCRIGERSSHTWFVLKYLLGHADVKNYDGSWTEWGNLVGAPVEAGEGTAQPNNKCA
jgi:thiosulfate/3-mercaptopyruvate sulfurtransferase